MRTPDTIGVVPGEIVLAITFWKLTNAYINSTPLASAP